MTDPGMMYEMLEPRVLFGMLGEQTTFLNLGYWKDRPASWDGAARALALRLGDAAGLGAGQEVLDVGFGYGDQDLLWMERYQPAKIVGLNVTKRQVAEAKQRVANAGLSDRIDLRVGSALATSFTDRAFDRVVALESAMHFDTRERFFHEAYRLLRAGGRLALADIVLAPGQGASPLHATRAMADTFIGRCPAANQYDRDEYQRRLAKAGYQNIQVESIREHVFDGLQDHVFRRSREMMSRWNPWMAAINQLGPMGAGFEGMARTYSGAFWARYDYVIATADKA